MRDFVIHDTDLVVDSIKRILIGSLYLRICSRGLQLIYMKRQRLRLVFKDVLDCNTLPHSIPA